MQRSGRRRTSVPIAMNAALSLAAIGFVSLQVAMVSTAGQTVSSTATKAADPGPRAGDPAAGGPIAGLSASELAYFAASQTEFAAEERVAEGLGPRMNLDSCGGCHQQPALGGSSPAVNPQIAMAARDGGTDGVPPFLALNGPVRETRFVKNADGTLDGGVHALFTISGRTGAEGCTLRQPDYETQIAKNNVIFRIPTPTFGDGLIEEIPDSAILENAASTASSRAVFGIRGKANFQVAGRAITGQTNNNGNDGTVARFGWKAQNKSLLVFAGEAYNVEMGITNELFPTEREETSSCQFMPTPNDTNHPDATSPIDAFSDIEKFAIFMRMLAPPAPSLTTPGGAASIATGKTLFKAVGCTLCHTPSFTTGNAAMAALRQVPVNLYSDLLVHDMGVGLADGVSQGEAGPREFRSAPLWGLGQRLFFLHDGRTSDLLAAIKAHASTGSEANSVVANFNALPETQKQNLLNFLRSL